MRHLVRIRFRAAADASFLAGGFEPGIHALGDQLSFKLSQSRKHVEVQLAARGRRVDIVAERAKMDAALLQVRRDLDQMPNAAVLRSGATARSPLTFQDGINPIFDVLSAHGVSVERDEQVPRCFLDIGSDGGDGGINGKLYKRVNRIIVSDMTSRHMLSGICPRRQAPVMEFRPTKSEAQPGILSPSKGPDDAKTYGDRFYHPSERQNGVEHRTALNFCRQIIGQDPPEVKLTFRIEPHEISMIRPTLKRND